MRSLTFDTETTGLIYGSVDPDKLDKYPYIVQFSFLIYDTDTNKVLKMKDYIIKIPENVEIPEKAIEVHGITQEKCKAEGVNIYEVLHEFFYYIRGVDIVVGHNTSFDINMIRVELLRAIHSPNVYPAQVHMYKADLHFINQLEKEGTIYCTMRATTEFCNIPQTRNGKPTLGKKWPQLGELHNKLFDITPAKLHNSLNDVLVTLRCYMKYEYDFDLLDNCDTFSQHKSLFLRD